MTIQVALHHRTTYTYDKLVSLAPQIVRLRPAAHCRTPILSYSLKVTPSDQFLNWQQDPYGNFLARLVFPKPTRKFEVCIDLVAEMTVINPFEFFLEPHVNEFPFAYDAAELAQLQPYLRTEALSDPLREFLSGMPKPLGRTIDFLVELNCYVQHHIGYTIRLEPGVQTCEETLTKRSGSCRDSAWLLVQTLRHLGLAARFVSGYLIQLKPDVKSLDGPSGAETDFTDLHAWTEVFLPGAGWVGLDPTSGLFAGEGHIPLSATPDPESAAPISGAVDPCEVEFEFDMKLTRVSEDPRVTLPYSDEQWKAIDQLGDLVDSQLNVAAPALTMGGEPTFVSIDNRDLPEWNTTALGDHKRLLAGDLFRRLAKRFASGPLLHFGQGKWYPGEQLPRWALGCYWRKDHEPVWHREELIAADNHDYGLDETDAHDFIESLAELLGVDGGFINPAYEDVWYYLWKERKLPINVDPFKSQLRDEQERVRLAKIFEKGLDKVTGYVLPIRPSAMSSDYFPTWESGPWFLRQERMYLIPGDSPIGFRLPTDSVPWIAPEDVEPDVERDPHAERDELPVFSTNYGFHGNGYGGNGNGHVSHAPGFDFGNSVQSRWKEPAQVVAQYAGIGLRPDPTLSKAPLFNSPTWNRLENFQSTETVTDTKSNALLPATWAVPQMGQSAKTIVRTALCVEARQGVLHVFMPPIAKVEHYLALVSVIEQTAEKLSLPVRIEGYPPPYDYRLDHFKVTPDPGVIEVNLQPAASWREMVHNTSVLYKEAHLCRLSTEKFMLDGRHTGTGGGNHIVIGGKTPAQSPFLKRPDLLRSLVSYWNNRPSLSYLFSGMFIGPTSQAPRIDEARHESLYELETACSQLPENGPCPPWLVDRVFRHLLVDVTGNTHRSEFCVDKLFSPDTSTGRLGLVEFRGFEMPPHERMSLTQQLLVRALMAKFWHTPYKEPLVRWGTMLHDRFLLPHFIEQDFQEVLEDLNAAGFPFGADWFDSHLEFRFPRIGEVTYRGVELELRQAIEPWHVLGEEPGGGGTVRYVDTSLERVQVKVQGMTDPRYVVACNGRRVPLHPTGVKGEFVAAVRFRAWQPPSCLHPTIGVHAPLVFDLIDLWNGRSLGGCTWHVSHPGGRSFETFPVNSYEAESRRAARFVQMGHTPGKIAIPAEEQNRDYPFTLDLRRPQE